MGPRWVLKEPQGWWDHRLKGAGPRGLRLKIDHNWGSLGGRLSGVWEEAAYLPVMSPVPSFLHAYPQTDNASTTPNTHLSHTLTRCWPGPGGRGLCTQGTQSLDRGRRHVWTHCLHPSPCLHTLGPRCVGVTSQAWPGRSPNTPPAQATPGKNLAATVIGPWTSIKTAGHTPQTAPTSPIP